MNRRGLPHDAAAERAAIGAAMLDPECLAELVGLLEPSHFYDQRNAIVWEALCASLRQGHATDTVGVMSQLGGRLEAAGGQERLLALTDTIPTRDSARRHGERVRKFAAIRDAATRAAEVFQSAMEPVEDLDGWLDEAQRRFSQPIDRPGATTAVHFREAIGRTVDAIERQAKAGSAMVGAPTGLIDLDRALKGLAPGQLVVCAGRPGMGKSAFAGGVAKHAGRCLIFSLEMTEEQWCRRHLSGASGIDGTKLRAANLEPPDWSALTRAAAEESEREIYFWDKPGTKIYEIARESRRVQRHLRDRGERLDLIIVDYMQLVKPSQRGRQREEEVAESSRELKSLAKEMGCAVLALAQVNRNLENRPNKQPMMSDLRESGAVEQDADVILFVYRDEVYNKPAPGEPDNAGLAQIIIAKQREGPGGVINVAWRKETTEFRDLESRRWADE